MKLCLASQGFTTNEIANEVEKLVQKPLNNVNICIVNECAIYLKNNQSKRWLIKELSNIEKYIGSNIDFVNFEVQSKEKIEESFDLADIIYFVGGKQHILSELFRRTDTTDLILKYSKSKVLMGTSAGSICMCEQITSEDFWKERYSLDINEVKKNPELDLVPFSIIPHYMREDHLKWNKDFLSRVLQNNEFPVYAIKDTQAVIYNDGNISFVGGKPEVFGKIEKE